MNTWCDLTLVLKDEIHEISLDVHKVVLSIHCPYFKAMFSQFQEKIANQCVVAVPSAVIAADVIRSFYDMPLAHVSHVSHVSHGKMMDGEYRLGLIDTYNFFGISVDPHLYLLKELVVPADKFGWLCHTVCSGGNIDEELIINTIYHNLTAECDLTCIPVKYLRRIREKVAAYDLIFLLDHRSHYELQGLDRTDILNWIPKNCVDIDRQYLPIICQHSKLITYYDRTQRKYFVQNYETGKVMSTIDALQLQPMSICYFNDGQQLMLWYGDHPLIKFYDATDGTLIKESMIPNTCNDIKIIDQHHLLLVNTHTICVWEINSRKNINIIPCHSDVRITLSTDNNMISMCTCSDDVSDVIIRSIFDDNIVAQFTIKHVGATITGVDFSWDDKEIAFSDNQGNIHIYHLITRELKQIQVAPGISNINYVPDNKSIIIYYDKGIRIMDLATRHIVKSIETATIASMNLACHFLGTELRNQFIEELDKLLAE